MKRLLVSLFAATALFNLSYASDNSPSSSIVLARPAQSVQEYHDEWPALGNIAIVNRDVTSWAHIAARLKEQQAQSQVNASVEATIGKRESEQPSLRARFPKLTIRTDFDENKDETGLEEPALSEDHFDLAIEEYVESEDAQENAQTIINETIHYAHKIIAAGGLEKKMLRALIQDKANALIDNAQTHKEKFKATNLFDEDTFAQKSTNKGKRAKEAEVRFKKHVTGLNESRTHGSRAADVATTQERFAKAIKDIALHTDRQGAHITFEHARKIVALPVVAAPAF